MKTFTYWELSILIVASMVLGATLNNMLVIAIQRWMNKKAREREDKGI